MQMMNQQYQLQNKQPVQFTKKQKASLNAVGGQIFSEVIIEDEDENWNDNANSNQVFTSHNTFQSYTNPYGQAAGNPTNIPSIKKSQNFENII